VFNVAVRAGPEAKDGDGCCRWEEG